MLILGLHRHCLFSYRHLVEPSSYWRIPTSLLLGSNRVQLSVVVRSLKGWLPNDAYWSHRDYTKDELQEQCRARKLSIIGYKWELVERLETYEKNDKSEKRRSSWKHAPPYPIDYAKSSEAAENAIFQVIRVMDKTGREGGYLDKHFTLLTGKAAHVLRYVLSCPEPFRWQYAFLSSELETMYRNSRAVYTLLCTD
ncbi:hypothetical protein N0V85_003473 [Neurospora sp. IMI 360204]|nr:hypothetical protein N0V85_003473 [Neurospora sp. IMI 360204]